MSDGAHVHAYVHACIGTYRYVIHSCMNATASVQTHACAILYTYIIDGYGNFELQIISIVILIVNLMYCCCFKYYPILIVIQFIYIDV